MLQKPDFMDPRHPLWHEVTDNGHYLVFEKPRHLSGYKLKGEKTCAKLCPRRWKEDMAGLIVLAPGPRAYVARQLHNVPHYEVTGYEMLRLRDMAKVVAKECSRFELLEVAYGDDIANNVSSLTDDFFHVRWLTSDVVAPLQQRFFRYRQCALNGKPGGRDPSRKTSCVHYGVCGNNNCTRKGQELGLSKPRFHEGTQTMEGKAWSEEMNSLLHYLFPHWAEWAYKDPAREKQFARACGPPGIEVNSRIEDGTLGINETLFPHRGSWHCPPKQSLGFHVDNLNDTDNQPFMVVFAVTWLLCWDDQQVWKLANIAYGKSSASDFMKRHDEYAKALQTARSLWHSIPLQDKVVTPSLVPGKHSPWKILPVPHLRKSVLYGIYADTIRLVLDRFPQMIQNDDYVLGLVYCVAATNAAQHFHHCCTQLIGNPSLFGPPCLSMEPMEFVYRMYTAVFSANRRPAADRPYKAHQRKQPTHNQPASRIQVENSVKALRRAVFEANSISRKEAVLNTAAYHNRLCANLVRPCPSQPMDETAPQITFGCFGVGPLIAQELLGVLVALGRVFHLEFMEHAEIAPSTRTWKYLSKAFGFEDHGRQSRQFLDALCHMLGIPRIVGEEFCCRMCQHFTKTSGRFRDSIPPGYSLLSLELEPNSNMLVLMRVKADGSRTHASFPRYHPSFLGVGISHYWKGAVREWGPRAPSFKVRGTGAPSAPSLLKMLPLTPGDSRKSNKTGFQPVLQVPYRQVILSKAAHGKVFDPTSVLAQVIPQYEGKSGWRTVAYETMYHQDLETGSRYSHKFLDYMSNKLRKARNMSKNQMRRGYNLRRQLASFHSCQLLLPNHQKLGVREVWIPPANLPLWNGDNPSSSVVWKGRRWFKDREESLLYATLALITDSSQSYQHHPVVRSFLEPVPTPAEKEMWDLLGCSQWHGSSTHRPL